jgi:hypothetical protein
VEEHGQHRARGLSPAHELIHLERLHAAIA